MLLMSVSEGEALPHNHHFIS